MAVILQQNFAPVTRITFNGQPVNKFMLDNTTLWFPFTVFSSSGGQIIGQSSYTSDGTTWQAYDSEKHFYQTFSMPAIRWDGGCSHGTWCDGTAVVAFHYTKELGSNALAASGASFSCDGCHRGSGIKTKVYNNSQVNGLALFDVEIDYSYFTFARTIYIPNSKLPFNFS